MCPNPMGLTTEFVDRVMNEAARQLSVLGMRRRNKLVQVYTFKVADDVTGSIGLNRATGREDKVLEINVVAGVTNHPVERLIAGALCEKPNPHVVTFSGHLGYLMPEKRYRPWLFRPGDRTDEAICEMVRAIQVHGMPYMESLRELSALRDALQTADFANPLRIDYTLPACQFLLGNKEAALGLVRTTVAKMEGKTDPAIERYRQFSDNLYKLAGG